MFRALTCVLLIGAFPVMADTPDQKPISDLIIPEEFNPSEHSLFDDTRTQLERLSPVRIQGYIRKYKSDMKNVRRAAWASIALSGVSLATLATWAFRPAGKKATVTSGKGKKINSEKPGEPAFNEGTAQISAKEEAETQYYLSNTSSFTNNLKKYTAATIVVGVLTGLFTTFKPLASITADSIGHMIKLWWHGYDQWFAQESLRFNEEIRDMRKMLHQARRVQVSYEAQRNMRMNREDMPVTYYRDEIITLYQRSLGRIEKIIALMILIAPKQNHDKIRAEVARLRTVTHRFADSLEHDINTNTRGFLTQYSDETLDLFHVLFEKVRPFIETFKVFWRR